MNFPLMIDAALAGVTISASSQKGEEARSNAGYTVVDSNDVNTPLSLGAALQVFTISPVVITTFAATLPQAINSFAASAKTTTLLAMGIPAHFMVADCGATMHLLLDLILAFADEETHRIIRGFHGRESVCIRAAQLAFSALVTCRGEQVRMSITLGVVDAFVTPDLNRPIFSVECTLEEIHQA
jgi:hypothetical protein